MMRNWRRLARAACAGVGFVFAGSALAASERVALVIGNAAYSNVPALDNPLADSRAIAASLKRLGFEVVEGYDEKLDAMRGTIANFASKLDGAKVALVYYAGHGVSVAGENYLLPTDASLKSEADLDFRTVNISLVLRQMQRDERTNIVILDACRDNPFKVEMQRSLKSRSASVGNGLAEISTQSSAGTMIAFSTDPGAIALDGPPGENSPFATALLKNMETPGISISAVLDRVREEVWTKTNKRQRPWTNTSIIGEFFLAAPPAATPQVAALGGGTLPGVNVGLPAVTPLVPQQIELRIWESAEKANTIEDYKAYLESYPNGLFATMARGRIARLSAGPVAPTPDPAAPVRTVSDADLAKEVGTAKTEQAIKWTPSDRRDAQIRLKALGFDPGKPTASFQPQTRKAIADWQRSRSTAETGYLTQVQRTALWEQSETEFQKLAKAPAERSARPTRAAQPRKERPPVVRVVREPRLPAPPPGARPVGHVRDGGGGNPAGAAAVGGFVGGLVGSAIGRRGF